VRLAGFLRRERVDILHTHLFEPSVMGLPAGVLARTPGRVMTRHYSDYHTRIDKHWHVRLDQMCTRLSHRVVAVSEHTREHMVRVEGAPAEKIRVIKNGIDFDRVKPSGPEAVGRVRGDLATGDAHLLLVPARLHPEKGHSHLFRALPALRSKLQRRLVVLLAGAGPFEAAYRDEVRQLGCEEMVRFLGFRRDITDLMCAADLVVVPSVAEAFGLVLAEALYLGRTVVATRVGGIPEIVDDGLDGILVPPGDSAALADAIARLLEHPEERNRLAGAGRRKVEQRFSFEAMTRAYEALYEELARGGFR
jgi:glycosyltransferase involved in cell wall biosynthesis